MNYIKKFKGIIPPKGPEGTKAEPKNFNNLRSPKQDKPDSPTISMAAKYSNGKHHPKNLPGGPESSV